VKAIRFRRRRPEKKKTELTVKDVISLTVSLLAFSLSAFATYIGVIRTNEQLTVAVAKIPGIRSAGDATFKVSSDDGVSLVFVNGGNKSIAITFVAVSIGHVAHENQEPKEACRGPLDTPYGTRLETDIAPQVVKANDVAVVNAKLVETRLLDTKTFKMPGPDGEQRRLTEAYVCLIVGFSTPSTHSIAVEPIRKWSLMTTKGVGAAPPLLEASSVVPILLHHRSGTIFN
jgi:hypothetical protein